MDNRVGKTSATTFAILTLLGLAVLFYLYVARYFEAGKPEAVGSGNTLVLRQARDGHYYAGGTINGTRVRFMVDTGASSVALSESLAREIGLPFGAKVQGQTANGVTDQWLTTIDEIAIGEVALKQVPAAILPNMDDEDVLLGMSFLHHFDWQRRDGEWQLFLK